MENDAPTSLIPVKVPRGQDGAAAAVAGYPQHNGSLPHPHALAGSLNAQPQQLQQSQQQHHQVSSSLTHLLPRLEL